MRPGDTSESAVSQGGVCEADLFETGVPPNRDGVGPSCVTTPPGPWLTVFEFLVQRFPGVTRDAWLARLARGDVIDTLGCAVPSQRPFEPHRKLFYYRSLPPETPIPFQEVVLYRDNYIVVVDKPHFLPVIPSGRYLQETLLVRLKRSLGVDTLAPVHRIDRDTAGLVLFTLQPATRGAYHALFREHRVCKRYEAIAASRPDLVLPLTRRTRLVQSATSFMQMNECEGTPNAETRIELLESRDGLARYRLQPLTGQKHQLRVHLAALGIPILNDRIYPHLTAESAGDAVDTERQYREPLQLLAQSLAFIDPFTGALREFESQRRLYL